MSLQESLSVERKRARDRQAQRVLRQKRETHITNLEKQVAKCQREHKQLDCNKMAEALQKLHDYGESLARCHKDLSNYLNTIEPDLRDHQFLTRMLTENMPLRLAQAVPPSAHQILSGNCAVPSSISAQAGRNFRNPSEVMRHEMLGSKVALAHDETLPVANVRAEAPRPVSTSNPVPSLMEGLAHSNHGEYSIGAATQSQGTCMVARHETSTRQVPGPCPLESSPQSQGVVMVNNHLPLSPASSACNFQSQSSTDPSLLQYSVNTDISSPLTTMPFEQGIDEDISLDIVQLELWAQTPLIISQPASMLYPLCGDGTDRQAILASPDLPEPLDLLYGSRKNYLANRIQDAVKKNNVRDPERLAIGYLVYGMSLWVVEPTKERFERIPRFLRPIRLQLTEHHHSCIDGVLWPRLRLNLIKNAAKYDLEQVVGLLSCCLKVKWPWGEDILEHNENDELSIRPSFQATFLQESGWGLTPEFFLRYPGLAVGLNKPSIVYTPH